MNHDTVRIPRRKNRSCRVSNAFAFAAPARMASTAFAPDCADFIANMTRLLRTQQVEVYVATSVAELARLEAEVAIEMVVFDPCISID